MSNFSKRLLVSVLLASNFIAVSQLCAVKDTQKTELILRDHQYRTAAFSTFHELMPEQRSYGFGTKVQATLFYNETQKSNSLGEVFGACGRNYITVGTPSQVSLGLADVENNFLLHRHSVNADNSLKGTIKFNPKRTAYGTHIEALIRLDNIINGLYFKKNLVVMHVKNNLNVSYCDQQSGATEYESHLLCNILTGQNLKRAITGTPADADNVQSEQEALKYAKLCGSQCRTGLHNMETILGWRFLDKKNYYVGINAALHSPTGDRATAEYLWEPRLGNKHWGFGGGLEAYANLWSNKNQSFKLFFDANYRYNFKATERRTLGIKCVLTDSKYCKHILSHYYLLGESKKYMLYPAANILTKGVEVSPGSLVDGFIALNYNYKSFKFDVGYNLFWKERESVHLNRCDWTNGKYAIAKFSWETCNNLDPFDIPAPSGGTSDAQPANVAINYENVDTSVAETPSILSHSIFAGLGFTFNQWKHSFLAGIGGAYEFGDDRASADSFTLWAKLGLAF